MKRCDIVGTGLAGSSEMTALDFGFTGRAEFGRCFQKRQLTQLSTYL
jgi:hypothetical protein